ncbi:lytic transglycosylase domain-containing protein [Brevundimonas bacteroides]|uniref:lytic transglycosylase domain-containing protein n=1 Tax=Brevundimonas bacteroides TaxID=74311 RepID=UPI0004982776|nr:lytic transglycosylase domain-containing protein [Brevundimonas bacteroides]
MVKSLRIALLTAGLLATSAPALAQTVVDWRPAGGDLFAGGPLEPETAPVAADLNAPAERARLAPLSQPFMSAIADAAERHGLDPKLLHALVVVESAYRPTACSHVGACGLTQLMPATAAEMGVADRFDPAANLRGGADYLARQMLRFGDLRLALAAYNSGPGRVARLGRVPSIPETQAYVVSVVDCYLALTVGRSVRSSRECRTPEAAR